MDELQKPYPRVTWRERLPRLVRTGFAAEAAGFAAIVVFGLVVVLISWIIR